jgi:hypothetical protein
MIGGWILSPSLLAADLTRLGEQINALETAGVDWLHVDVMDGYFVPNISIESLMVEACCNVCSLPFDVHLMIEDPDRYIETFAKAGASLITIHIETGYHPWRTLQSIRALGCRPGIALNPGTPSTGYTLDCHHTGASACGYGTRPGHQSWFFGASLYPANAIKNNRNPPKEPGSTHPGRWWDEH